MQNENSDFSQMRHALTLAGRALGQVAPNPAVGCAIVRDGVVVGRGWTQKGGRPHAETMALAQAGGAARGATAYVTLEPCAHHGQTPPCANALIDAGVVRVVAAVEDPDPRVSGKGFAMLRAANIEVTTDVLKNEAAELNAGFFLRILEGRPLVTLKIAESADGFIAKPSGESKWITGEEARRFAHLLRARHDAILVGIGTVLADDPELTCRLPGLENRSPIRVVLDSGLRLSPASKLAQTARRIPTLVFTASDGGDELKELGVEIVKIADQGRPNVRAVLSTLAKRGITRLLVEGGAVVHAAFLEQGLADRLEIFRAPVTLGDGIPNVLNAEAGFVRTAERRLGPDMLESYAAKA
jgi:diaminohydroxyphosphoribosylaminopyrimidine deaminase/5-amino-6-(5-phosphoribosylamino)uracil reductase